MSAPRFASITGELLARKGEALPWGTPDAPRPYIPDDAPPPPPPVIKPPVVAGVAGPMPHRCTIRMSAHDFQRLGIVAVKDGTTRQHLLQQALADFLAAKEQEYRRTCRCMAAEPCGVCDPR